MTSQQDPRVHEPDFRLVFESFPGLCILIDPEFRILAISDSLLANTQAAREDLVGKVLYEAFPDNPDEPDTEGARNLQASLERVRDSLQPDQMPVQRYDVQLPGSEGGGFTERYWTPTNSPVVKDGRLVYIVQRVEDITAYVQMARAAEASGDNASNLRAQVDAMAIELVSRAEEVAQASRRLKETNAELERLYKTARDAAMHDPLTGLANRALLRDHMMLALADLDRTLLYVGVIFLDLDGFKAVNDRYGHSAGDAVLQETGRRLRHAVRPGDTVARLGGDEFVVLCPALDAPADVAGLARRVDSALRDTPVTLGRHRLAIGASLGTAVTNDSRHDLDALLSAADAAMYEQRRLRSVLVDPSRDLAD
jgi:diguanylate cyclase (GGDEF)-like protein